MKSGFHFLCVAIIALWMLMGGTAHFLMPEYFYSIVPDVFPKKAVVYATGVPELMIGVGVLWPKTRALAGLSFSLLCIAFLPLHIWDLFRDEPAITPQTAAIIRVFVQGILIWIGWRVWRYKPT